MSQLPHQLSALTFARTGYHAPIAMPYHLPMSVHTQPLSINYKRQATSAKGLRRQLAWFWQVLHPACATTTPTCSCAHCAVSEAEVICSADC